MRWRHWGAAAVFGGTNALALWALSGGDLRPGNLEYTDLVTIMFTGAAVLLAAVGVALAVGAIWGASQFKLMTEKAAQAAAVSKVEEEIKNGEIKRQIKAEVIQLYVQGIRDGSLGGYAEEAIAEANRMDELDEQTRQLREQWGIDEEEG